MCLGSKEIDSFLFWIVELVDDVFASNVKNGHKNNHFRNIFKVQ